METLSGEWQAVHVTSDHSEATEDILSQAMGGLYQSLHVDVQNAKTDRRAAAGPGKMLKDEAAGPAISTTDLQCMDGAAPGAISEEAVERLFQEPLRISR